MFSSSSELFPIASWLPILSASFGGSSTFIGALSSGLTGLTYSTFFVVQVFAACLVNGGVIYILALDATYFFDFEFLVQLSTGGYKST